MYFKDFVDLDNCIDAFLNMPDKSRPIILFGGGFALERILLKLENSGFNIVCICDNNLQKQGTVYKDKYYIMSLEESIKRFPNAIYIISSPNYFDEIKSQLEKIVDAAQICNIDFECGHYFSGREFKKFVITNKDKFQKFYDNLYDDLSKKVLYNITKAHFSGERTDFQKALSTPNDWYLFKSLLKPDSQSVYIDCGAFDGDTLVAFKNAATKGYKKIYAFEPDEEIQKDLKMTIDTNQIDNVQVIKKGAYNKEGILSFVTGGVYSLIESSNSSVQLKSKTTEIEVTTIDKELNGEFVDIIKIDIEGAEHNALIGASDTIKKHKPRLAVCLYHNIDDFITIQELLLSVVPEYKLSLRQHLPNCTDTILYAYI